MENFTKKWFTLSLVTLLALPIHLLAQMVTTSATLRVPTATSLEQTISGQVVDLATNEPLPA